MVYSLRSLQADYFTLFLQINTLVRVNYFIIVITSQKIRMFEIEVLDQMTKLVNKRLTEVQLKPGSAWCTVVMARASLSRTACLLEPIIVNFISTTCYKCVSLKNALSLNEGFLKSP